MSVAARVGVRAVTGRACWRLFVHVESCKDASCRDAT